MCLIACLYHPNTEKATLKNRNFFQILGFQRSAKEQTVEHSERQPTDTDSQKGGETQDASMTEPMPQEASEAPSAGLETKEEPAGLQSELAAKIEELKDLNDKYLRLAAEFENYKRRVQREQSETIRFANEKLLKELLPTIDNLERAIQCGREQSEGDGLLQGVELTYKQFLDTLEKLGVRQVTSQGEPFDPAKHQAVGQVESSAVNENHVVDEYQKG